MQGSTAKLGASVKTMQSMNLLMEEYLTRSLQLSEHSAVHA